MIGIIVQKLSSELLIYSWAVHALENTILLHEPTAKIGFHYVVKYRRISAVKLLWLDEGNYISMKSVWQLKAALSSMAKKCYKTF